MPVSTTIYADPGWTSTANMTVNGVGAYGTNYSAVRANALDTHPIEFAGQFFVGQDGLDDGASTAIYRLYQGFLTFDLSGIPAGSHIQSAKLILYERFTSQDKAITLEAYRRDHDENDLTGSFAVESELNTLAVSGSTVQASSAGVSTTITIVLSTNSIATAAKNKFTLGTENMRLGVAPIQSVSQNEQTQLYGAESTATATRPRIELIYTPGGSDFGSLF